MKKAFKIFGLLFSIIMVVGILAGCGSASKAQLKVYNWGDYIDETVIDEFEKKYNIDVIYDTFATNEEMYVKIKGGGADYDVAIPSDYMIERMIKEGMLEKIDFSNVPNYKYIDERFKNLPYDPNNEYSVPYMWGTVGILYNKKMVKEPVDSWKILWDEKYKKQIFMLDSSRDSIGVALKMLGYSLNTRNMDELEQAKEALIRQKPLVLSYVSDEVKNAMISGQAALAVVWSGDAVYTKRENPDLEYAIPKEGSNLWVDAMVILKGTKNKKVAEQFINFMCEPEIAYRNTTYIGYSTPHTEARKMLPPEILNDRTAYPTDEDLKNCEVFEALSDVIKEYDRVWTEVKAAR
ncbi:spermidine/putrescine transport system substrate-binding protein [Caldicoprobacter guelmensis]|uniref:ABC transporter substrate-binding protein n=1 Tax=Caldicoprobacter guelmensis TaxID=1170224 RepID=UPI00195A79ED|nr:spermidine/putrescine ABC transporter substrate-binding protein [Caldicoprobacter guelmensis]MBM7583339.1 spermidine/putrescine transport system substrate-binding protein [Caldicoprobacter guelmensis]